MADKNQNQDTNLNSDYVELLGKSREITLMDTATGIINWDMETKMPPKGIGLRSEQLALLSGVEYRMVTDQAIGALLTKLQGIQDFGEEERRNIYLVKKGYDENVKLPEKLVTDTTRQTAIAIDTWKKAKAAKDYQQFRPELEKLMDLRKQAADILRDVKGTATAYDALIDIYEPKMGAQQITGIFDKLRDGLVTLIQKCQTQEALGKQPDTSFLARTIPTEQQRKIADELAKTIQYDVESKQAGGRIDETEHPFTTGYYDDVRITTHYYLNDYANSIFSVLHESGHAIYEQNLPGKWKYQPVGSTASFGVHESQSRFYENIIGRSSEFWQGFLPKIKSAAPSLSDVELGPFVHAVNKVERSKIRIEADEVTYSLHIIIRFELERDLFADKVSVDELPEVWNQKYQDYLGVKVGNDSEGVMQDTHWASGLYGYFPSYALGNIYDGQIRAAINRAIPDWQAKLAAGNLEAASSWLKENIHCKGNLYDPEELIKTATGSNLDAQPFLQYLNEKYGKLYGF